MWHFQWKPLVAPSSESLISIPRVAPLCEFLIRIPLWRPLVECPVESSGGVEHIDENPLIAPLFFLQANGRCRAGGPVDDEQWVMAVKRVMTAVCDWRVA